MDLGNEVVAHSIEEAAAVIVECAMNGAINVTMETVGHLGEEGASGRRANNYITPSTTDSGITMMNNGLGKDHIEMDTSELNDSTTTETSALSEVIDQVIDRTAEAIANEHAATNERLVDLNDIGIITTPYLKSTETSVSENDTEIKEVNVLLNFSVDAGTGTSDATPTDVKHDKKDEVCQTEKVKT